MILRANVSPPWSGDNERLHYLLYKNCLISACMSDTVCTIQKKITAVNTFILLGISDYVSCLALRSVNKDLPNNQKVADAIGRKKIQFICLIYS